MKGTFPKDCKNADVTHIFNKDNPPLAKNYRPVNVLPTVSQIFEETVQKQIINFINQYLFPLLCGYRKGFSTQTVLLYFIKKWKFMLDKKGYVGAILTELSKAFNIINYNLLVVKLNAYGISKRNS